MTSKTGKKNNYNRHIAQYLQKEGQPGNNIWSVNRIYHAKYFVSKNLTQNLVEKLVLDTSKKIKIKHIFAV